jgi:hypothetical protein
VSPTTDVGDGTLREPLLSYTDALAESVILEADVGDGEIRTLLLEYDNLWDGVENTADVGDGTIETKLLEYLEYDPESVLLTADVNDGTLV